MSSSDNSAPTSDVASDAHQSALEALAYAGLQSGSVQGAIIVGGVTPELLAAMDRLVPAPRPFLLLDTLDSLTELERRAEACAATAALAGRCTTIVLDGAPAVFYLPAYLATWAFLMAHGLDPATVALCGGNSADDDLVQRAHGAVADLVLCHSSRFLALVDRRSLPVAKVLEWALFAAQQGSSFHALKLLYALGDAVPRERLASTIVELWAALGCPEPALAWLDALEPEQRRHCELPLRQAAAARQELMRETLEQNRAALARCSLSLPEPVGGERSVHIAILPSVPWRPAPGGGAQCDRYPCLFRIQAGKVVELSPPGHPRALFKSLQKQRQPHEAVAMLGGLASPTLFQVLSELPTIAGVPDWKRKVYVLEEDPDVLQAFLCTLDIEPLLAEDRFELLLGPGATQRFEQRLIENPLLPLPEIVVDMRREQVDVLVRVRDQRVMRTAALTSELAERYTPERLARLPRLLEPSRPRALRVLIYTSFFTSVLKYQARDMAAAFESLGHEVRLLHEGHPTLLMTTHAILQTVADFDPDLLYLLDVIRPAVKGLPQRLPVVCWIQDELPRLSRLDTIAQLGPLDFTFCLSAEWTRRYREMGYPHTAQLSMAADPTLYAPPEQREAAGAGPAQLPPSSPAVVMITHVTRTAESFRGLFAHVEPILRAEIKMRPTVLQYDPEIRAAAAALGVELDAAGLDEARRSVHTLARHVELTTVARWLVEAGLDVGLYGDGWRELPDLKGHARGVLRPGRELSAVYSGAKVVLHINGTMNCHVRLFECLATGGLPLCRSHASDYDPGELNDALRIGQEVLCFDGRRDLLEKLDRLLGDEAYRQSIIRAGRQRVLNEHCMRHRMLRTLDEIWRQLPGGEAVSELRPRGAEPAAEPMRDAAALMTS
jgi:hypothetical protein